MTILIKLFLNSKLDLSQTVKFVQQLKQLQILKGRKVLLWNQVKSRMEACYSELVLEKSVNKTTDLLEKPYIIPQSPTTPRLLTLPFLLPQT